jgi:hypothetical protein
MNRLVLRAMIPKHTLDIRDQAHQPDVSYQEAQPNETLHEVAEQRGSNVTVSQADKQQGQKEEDAYCQQKGEGNGTPCQGALKLHLLLARRHFSRIQ